ncbi:MAG: tyrosine-type recombinase/integrase [Gammaproteobacteria bacterium]|nr:tyrosine-type recombinase/integrase [Gammaproteobacteria bacterium]
MVRSLKTSDLRVAQARRHGVLAEFEEEFKRRRGVQDPSTPLTDLKATARSIFAQRRSGELSDEDADQLVEVMLDEVVGRMGRAGAERQERQIGAYVGLAQGQEVSLYSEVLPTYLAAKAGTVKHRTLETQQVTLAKFAAWCGGDPDLAAITRKQVGQWMSATFTTSGRSPKTQTGWLSDLSSFMDWCESRGVIERNPCAGLSRSIKGKGKGKTPRRDFTDAELLAVLQHLKDGKRYAFWSVWALLLYSGMRLGELLATRLEHVPEEGDRIFIPGGKTSAARRTVPVHPITQPLVKHLRKRSTDEYLFPGLPSYGEDLQRGRYCSSRLATQLNEVFPDIDRKAAGISTHSLRHTFISSAINRAEAQPHIVRQIVGHAEDHVTLQVYSHGPSFDIAQRVVASVSYGPEVDGYVRERIAEMIPPQPEG